MLVQEKTYYGGGKWYTLDIDYKKVAGILKKHDYNGFISLEFEGQEAPETAILSFLFHPKVSQKAFGISLITQDFFYAIDLSLLAT